MKRLTSMGLLLLVLAGCSRSTGGLEPAVAQRLESEGIVRRADDAEFRYTEGGGRRGGTWDEGRASIVVTRRSVYLHQNRRVMLDLGARDGTQYAVHRDHDRVAIHIGRGTSAKTWSFQPPDDADGWTRDMRSVLQSAPAETTP